LLRCDFSELQRRRLPLPPGEIEREGGKLIYSFDMKVPGKSGIDEVNIDAMTKQLVSHQHETPKAEHAEAKADAKAKR